MIPAIITRVTSRVDASNERSPVPGKPSVRIATEPFGLPRVVELGRGETLEVPQFLSGGWPRDLLAKPALDAKATARSQELLARRA